MINDNQSYAHVSLAARPTRSHSLPSPTLRPLLLPEIKTLLRAEKTTSTSSVYFIYNFDLQLTKCNYDVFF